MMHDFSLAVREAVKDERTRCVVVRGENGNFCSGGELNFVEKVCGILNISIFEDSRLYQSKV